MGNWHCIPSSCAEVVYREYEPPKIRWRYGNEPWQEIIADNYSTNQELGQCNVSYIVKGRLATNGLGYCGASWQIDPTPINSWTINTNGRVLGLKRQQHNLQNKYQTLPNGACGSQIIGTTWQWFSYLAWVGQTNISSGGLIYFDEKWIGNFDSQPTGKEVVKIDSIKRADGLADNCGNYIFKVFKNGQTVYTEARTTAPEVEKIPCKLSDVRHSIEIKKLPYLERVEVIPWAYDVRYGLIFDSDNYGFLLAKKAIPDQCLNIYNNSTTSLIPSNFNFITNTPENGFNLIAQICSAPGCPPPEYQVICDCNNCQSCPDNTCPIDCDDHICCYNDYGISVQSIPKANYCGGNL
jgi:hypothetical protein